MSRKNLISPEILGKAADLGELVAYSSGSVVSKTLIDKPAGTITLFSFDAGQGLSEHTAPYEAFVQVIDGEAKIRLAEDVLKVSAGQVVVMPAHVPHAISAEVPFKMLLVMIRSVKE